MKRVFAVVAALAAVIGLTACGEKTEQTTSSVPTRTITLMLDYLPNADHVGLYEAIAAGDFAKAGIDVKVETPSDPAEPLKLLEAGKVDMVISYEPEVLLARDKGAQVVSVGAIAQTPLTALMSTNRRKIKTAADLRGTNVGTAGIPYQSAYLRTILAHEHVPADSVKETNVGFNLVPAMLSRRVDATIGAFWNVEGVQLREQRKNPRIIRMETVGVPTYNELVLASRKNYVGPQGDLVRAFVQAVGRGYEAARADPQAATDALVRANPDLDPRLTLASVKASLPVFFPRSASKPFGWQEPGEWTRYGDWMFDQGLLDARPDAGAAAITNEFLAGQSGVGSNN
ncbi:MAG TPA: ABC transporter substrate-binding protein [Conexibacter sp.]|jgi:putative hydroxymethylpyrimidine transport system substrate-binding protein